MKNGVKKCLVLILKDYTMMNVNLMKNRKTLMKILILKLLILKLLLLDLMKNYYQKLLRNISKNLMKKKKIILKIEKQLSKLLYNILKIEYFI